MLGKQISIFLETRRRKSIIIINRFVCRDADDAVKARDGYDYDGYRLRVEFPRGGGGPSGSSFRGSRQGNI